MKEIGKDITVEQVQQLILKETIFPTKISEIKGRILEQGIDTQLVGITMMDMTNQEQLVETPGYIYQAKALNPHQLHLPNFEVESTHEERLREIVAYFREILYPLPCH